MTAITVSNLRITPFSQKDNISKIVFGDQWEITIKLPTPHIAGDKYAIGIDYENTLYPPNRPLCAGTDQFVVNGDELTFNVKLGTARLRDWLSSIRKPMPVNVQITRIRANKGECLMLDTLLALPSVFDGVVTVCEGDAIQVLLDAKLDKPAISGSEGDFLSLDENGNPIWKQVEIPEQQQANWDESDSTDVSYIQGKPTLASVATSGNYNDLNNKPDLSVYVEKVEGKGLSTNDFTDAEKNKLSGIANGAEVNVNADWDESDSGDDAFIKNKPTIPTVNDATVTINQGGVEKGTFTLNQSGNTTINLNDGAQSDWDESDSTDVSYIENKPQLATVATTGSYNDLTNKPEIPEDNTDYFCISLAFSNNHGICLNKHGNPSEIQLEYSYDKQNWTQYSWTDSSGLPLTFNNVGDRVYFRGNNSQFSVDSNNFYFFTIATSSGVIDVNMSGNICSLLSKKCDEFVSIPQYAFCHLFEKTDLNNGMRINNSNAYVKCRVVSSNAFDYMYYGQRNMTTCGDFSWDSLSLPSNTTGKLFSHCFDGCSTLAMPPKIPSYINIYDTYNDLFEYMFNNCSNLEKGLDFVMYSHDASTNFSYMYSGCTYLRTVTFNVNSTRQLKFNHTFDNCNNLLELHYYCRQQYDFVAPTLPNSTIIYLSPGDNGWAEYFQTMYPNNLVICGKNNNVVSSQAISGSSTYTLSYGLPNAPIVSVASALTLSATALRNGLISYAEIVLDIASGATVTAGTNLTIVDTLTENKRNICVARWSGGVAKLYVTMVEDLPQA